MEDGKGMKWVSKKLLIKYEDSKTIKTQQQYKQKT